VDRAHGPDLQPDTRSVAVTPAGILAGGGVPFAVPVGLTVGFVPSTGSGPTVSPPTTSSPLVTIVGGQSPVPAGVGSHNDSADLYGLVVGLLVIVVSIFAVRWIFGRGRGGVQSSAER